MRLLKIWWKDLSISKKLYLVVGVMAVLIAGELLVLRFAMRQISAARAFVGGESLWSKAQKDAVFSLQRYASTRSEKDYLAFLNYLKIPEGDRKARTELMKPHPDVAVVYQGFIEGQIHPDDVPGIVKLLQRFHWISYLKRSIDVWTRADDLIVSLRNEGEKFHAAVKAANFRGMYEIAEKIKDLNEELTPLEAEFSAALGEGSRWLEGIVNKLLFLVVFTVESFGLSITFLTTRALTRGLKELTAAADALGSGDFSRSVPVRSRDEIGRLAVSVNQMRELLEKSYKDLEYRVEQRTRELAKLADENAKLYQEAKLAVQTRDEFLSIASHELRTPLTALTLQLQMLINSAKKLPESQEAPRFEDLTERSVRSARRLTILLDELLDLTRLRLGKFEVHPVQCDLVPIVCEAVAQHGAEAAKRGSQITVDAPTSVLGRFDPTRISQIVTNLVSNAIKYGEGRPIEVSVTRKGGSAIIRVEDHGAGIPAENLDKIFERFERAEADPSIQGLGLGLYITKQIVEIHGGKIKVDSWLSQGSVFTVELSA